MHFADYLRRLQAVYGTQAPELSLHPGATEAALDTVETQLGFPIALELKEAWRLADGGGRYTPVFQRPGFLTGYDFLPLSESMAERGSMQKRAARYTAYGEPASSDPRIRPGWFHPGWLPFAGFGGGTLLLMADHSPGPAGQVGQIIAFTHDPDEIDWVAPSFSALLSASIAGIEDDPDEFLGDY